MNDYERRRRRLPSAAKYASAPEKSGKHLNVNDPRNARSKEVVGGKATNEFGTLNVKTEDELEGHLLDVANRDETLTYTQSDGSTVYFNKDTNTYFVDNVSSPEKSTAFRPSDHISGYDNGEYGLKYFAQGYNEELDNYDRKGLPAPQINTVGELRAMHQPHQERDEKRAIEQPPIGQPKELSPGSLDQSHYAPDGQPKRQYVPDQDRSQTSDYARDRSVPPSGQAVVDNQTQRARTDRSAQKGFVDDAPANSSAQDVWSQTEDPTPAGHAEEQDRTNEGASIGSQGQIQELQKRQNDTTAIELGGRQPDQPAQPEFVQQDPADSTVQQDQSEAEWSTPAERVEEQKLIGRETNVGNPQQSQTVDQELAPTRGIEQDGRHSDQPPQGHFVQQNAPDDDIQQDQSQTEGVAAPEPDPQQHRAVDQELTAKRAIEQDGNQTNQPSQGHSIQQATPDADVQQDQSQADEVTAPQPDQQPHQAVGQELAAKRAIEQDGNQTNQPSQGHSIQQATPDADVQQDQSQADEVTAPQPDQQPHQAVDQELAAKRAIEQDGNQTNQPSQGHSIQQATPDADVQQDQSQADEVTAPQPDQQPHQAVDQELAAKRAIEQDGNQTNQPSQGPSIQQATPDGDVRQDQSQNEEVTASQPDQQQNQPVDQELAAKRAIESDSGSQSNDPNIEVPTHQPAPGGSGRDDDR